MGGRDKNFDDPMQSDEDIRKTRYGRRRFSKTHPLSEGTFIGQTFVVKKDFFKKKLKQYKCLFGGLFSQKL